MEAKEREGWRELRKNMEARTSQAECPVRSVCRRQSPGMNACTAEARTDFTTGDRRKTREKMETGGAR